ncbi:MAG: T9SS type A sorting domain-containing protein [Saprospiraceae bacterium]|nr:T9SS type A sorting domain-containing protein [Saprospiraceae bacterium]
MFIRNLLFKSMVFCCFFLTVFTAKASIFCPPAKTIMCNDDIHYLPLTGKATAFNYPASMVKYSDNKFLNNCNVGTINRIWYIDLNQDGIYQNTESSCTQILTLQYIENTIEVFFPDNKIYNCKEDITDDKPTWIAGPCDVIGYSVHDNIFEVADDACYKIFRKFTVINWCTHDDQNSDNTGTWTHTQIIKVIEKNPPSFSSCKDTIIGVENDCKASIILTNKATDDNNCASPLLTWYIEVDLWANGTTDYRYGPDEPAPFKILPVTNGSEIKLVLPERVGKGKHKIKWSVKDQCGNFRTCTTQVITKDLKKPTPYLYPLLTTAFEGNFGGIKIPAKLFNRGSFDNCTPITDLKYSFSSNVNDTLRLIDCNNAGFQFFNIIVTDNDGNQENTDVFMLVFDNGSCSSGFRLAGNITEANGNPIPLARLNLTNPLMGQDVATYSDQKGDFTWENVSLYKESIIEPVFLEPMTGRVDIADFKMLQDYILGNHSLLNFQLLAADLDKDRKIRIKDLELLRKKILLPAENNEDLWSFAVDLDTLTHPGDLLKVKDRLPLAQSDGSIDFKATYLGDITDANERISGPRSEYSLVKKTNEKTVEYIINDDLKAEGIQIELSFPNSLGEVLVNSPYFQIKPSDIHVDNSLNTLRFIIVNDIEVPAGQALFTLQFNDRIDQSTDISLTSYSRILFGAYKTTRIIEKRSYDPLSDLVLTPNPNQGVFTINNVAAKVTGISNINGENIPFYQMGQTVEINSDIPGIYLIHVQYNGQSYTEKLIKI